MILKYEEWLFYCLIWKKDSWECYFYWSHIERKEDTINTGHLCLLDSTIEHHKHINFYKSKEEWVFTSIIRQDISQLWLTGSVISCSYVSGQFVEKEKLSTRLIETRNTVSIIIYSAPLLGVSVTAESWYDLDYGQTCLAPITIDCSNRMSFAV